MPPVTVPTCLRCGAPLAQDFTSPRPERCPSCGAPLPVAQPSQPPDPESYRAPVFQPVWLNAAAIGASVAILFSGVLRYRETSPEAALPTLMHIDPNDPSASNAGSFAAAPPIDVTVRGTASGQAEEQPVESASGSAQDLPMEELSAHEASARPVATGKKQAGEKK